MKFGAYLSLVVILFIISGVFISEGRVIEAGLTIISGLIFMPVFERGCE